VEIPKNGDWIVLQNQYQCARSAEAIPLTSQDPKINQRANFKGDRRASPSRQVPCDKNDSELVDVAGSETAPLPMGDQDSDIKKCTNLKGDHCATPLRQVSQHDNGINEPVDEAVIE
jgi:hypothetical protein